MKMKHKTHERLEPMHPLPVIAKGSLERVLWARRMFGLAPIAAAMIYAYVLDGEFRTAKEIAELSDVSEDTARRHLKPLVGIGRVDCRRHGRVICYRLTDDMAQKAIDQILTVPRSVPL